MRFPHLRPRLAAAIWHPRVVVSLVALLVLALPLGILTAGRGGESDRVRLTAGTPGVHTYREIDSATDFARGTASGVRNANGTLVLSAPTAKRTWGGRTYEYGSWTSEWIVPGQTFKQLVPSWKAATLGSSWIQVLVQVRDSTGRTSGYKDLGRWAASDGLFKRSSAGAQSDAVARVGTDTLKANAGVTLTRYRFLVRLMRAPGGQGPAMRMLGAVVSRLPSGTPPVSTPLQRTAVTLKVPSYSQMTHSGQNPQYGGGGEAWCSPTSLAMVLGYYGRLPSRAEYSWTNYREGFVNHLARLTYDYTYEGAGNWPFNTAVGADRAGAGFVTRLPDLRTAERLIRAGIPLIVSIRFSSGQLTGAPIASSNGHLTVLAGFTATGRPVVNEPAAGSNATVRRSYDRAQFERAWQNGSAGMAYVIRDAAHPLPTRPVGTHYW